MKAAKNVIVKLRVIETLQEEYKRLSERVDVLETNQQLIQSFEKMLQIRA